MTTPCEEFGLLQSKWSRHIQKIHFASNPSNVLGHFRTSSKKTLLGTYLCKENGRFIFNSLIRFTFPLFFRMRFYKPDDYQTNKKETKKVMNGELVLSGNYI